MRTEEEIKERLEQIESDVRLKYAPAKVETNVVLAMIQLSLETQRDILKWVLK